VRYVDKNVQKDTAQYQSGKGVRNIGLNQCAANISFLLIIALLEDVCIVPEKRIQHADDEPGYVGGDVVRVYVVYQRGIYYVSDSRIGEAYYAEFDELDYHSMSFKKTHV
jgi:hypothetical protein